MLYFFIFLFLVLLINRFASLTQSILFRSLHSLTGNLTFSTYLVAALYLPGVIIHELSHLVMAVFLLLEVKSISFIPHAEPLPNGIGLRLGSVGYYRRDPIRGALVGVAPFIVGIIILYLLFLSPFLSQLETPWRQVVLTYLVFIISSTMFSSKQDLVDVWIVVVFFAILSIILLFFGVPLFDYLTAISISPVYTKLISQLNLYLFYSVIVNAAVYMVLKMILGRK